MKTKLKPFLGALALSIFFVACDKSNNDQADTIIDEAIAEETVDEVIETGTVSLTPFVKDVIQAQAGKALELEEILDVLGVNIYSNGTLNYSALYNDFLDPLELPPGNYEFMMSTTNDGPQYGGDGSFVVLANANTTVNAVLGLMDVAVTLIFSEEILLNYPDISAEAIISNYSDGYIPANNTLFWNAGIFGTGYFRMDEYEWDPVNFIKHSRSADITVEVSALHPDTGEEISAFKTYEGVIANQHYNVTVDYSTSGSSSTSFNFTLTEENTIDDTITFPN